MKEEIRAYLDSPKQLEQLYRANKASFKRSFTTIYPELKGHPLAEAWHERLSLEGEGINWGTRKEAGVVIGIALLAGLIAKLPAILGIDPEFFYSRNIGFIVFPLLAGYFAWKNKLSPGRIALIAAVGLAGVIFINLLPKDPKSDTLVLSCIHSLPVLWSLLAIAFVGGKDEVGTKRLAFLKYNGDALVMTGLICIAGGILTGVTIGLFSLLGFKNFEKFYFENIGIFGLAAAPFVGTYLTQTNPQLVGWISPVIAKLFSPLVLVMLIVYLVSMGFSGKNPYSDRDFLVVFNALLVGVMALIFFSVAENTKTVKSPAEVWVLAALSAITILVNGIALSAILFRISEWGITPNRTAILGANVLILVNLVMVAARLFRVLAKKAELDRVGNAIALYLPVYAVWAAIVMFLFPFVFGFN